MKLIEYTNKDGYKNLVWLKDNQSEKEAKNGIPANPPDLDRIDWDDMKKQIHNALVDQRLIDWQAVQKKQNAVTGIVNRIVRRQIIALYRGDENE